MTRLETLQSTLKATLGDNINALKVVCGQVIIECLPQHYHAVMTQLRDTPGLAFEQLIDLCGVDYHAYRNEPCVSQRFAVVSQLLSVSQNQRVRVKVFAEDNAFPVVDSVVDIYNAADWYEREAFDLYGIMFNNHPDLRRILTDYGFVGHPFRKDFPISGYMEMRYDEVQGRVVYQPVTIEPREVTPRIVREENYGG